MFVQSPPSLSSSMNSVVPSTSLPSQEFPANDDYSTTTTASLSSATASIHCSEFSFFLTNLFDVDSNNDNFVSAYLTCMPPHPPTLQTLIKLCASIPPSLKNPPTPLQVAGALFSAWFARNPLVSDVVSQVPLSLAYKKVANKTRPVATMLPENFCIVQLEHLDPLTGMPPLPPHPPDFVPTGLFTLECHSQMPIGQDFLWPEEIKLAEWIICTHNLAFTWTDEERGLFDPEYFAPIKIPHISHVPWVLQQ